jgi:hypothetical protein
VAAVAAAAVGFFFSVDHPVGYVQDKVEELKGTPKGSEGSSHFETLESERYDVWRVAVREFWRHPVAGIGTRGFYAAYLEHGRTIETPARAHSLPLDALAENGVIGLLLLVLALAPPLAVAARASRASVAVCAAFAACIFWLVHASVDWIWTVPANGIVFFSFLGLVAAGSVRVLMRPGVAAASAAAVAGVVLVLFGPAWLAARYVERALTERPAAAERDLERARRLDPISTSTYVVEAQLARNPAARIRPLQKAVQSEPRSAGLRLLLGVAYRDAGREADARRELSEAARLAPRDKEIRRVLRGR